MYKIIYYKLNKYIYFLRKYNKSLKPKLKLKYKVKI